jgi:hypothetical protein
VVRATLAPQSEGPAPPSNQPSRLQIHNRLNKVSTAFVTEFLTPPGPGPGRPGRPGRGCREPTTQGLPTGAGTYLSNLGTRAAGRFWPVLAAPTRTTVTDGTGDHHARPECETEATLGPGLGARVEIQGYGDPVIANRFAPKGSRVRPSASAVVRPTEEV